MQSNQCSLNSNNRPQLPNSVVSSENKAEDKQQSREQIKKKFNEMIATHGNNHKALKTFLGMNNTLPSFTQDQINTLGNFIDLVTRVLNNDENLALPTKMNLEKLNIEKLSLYLEFKLGITKNYSYKLIILCKHTSSFYFLGYTNTIQDFYKILYSSQEKKELDINLIKKEVDMVFYEKLKELIKSGQIKTINELESNNIIKLLSVDVEKKLVLEQNILSCQSQLFVNLVSNLINNTTSTKLPDISKDIQKLCPDFQKQIQQIRDLILRIRQDCVNTINGIETMDQYREKIKNYLEKSKIFSESVTQEMLHRLFASIQAEISHNTADRLIDLINNNDINSLQSLHENEMYTKVSFFELDRYRVLQCIKYYAAIEMDIFNGAIKIEEELNNKLHDTSIKPTHNKKQYFSSLITTLQTEIFEELKEQICTGNLSKELLTRVEWREKYSKLTSELQNNLQRYITSCSEMQKTYTKYYFKKITEEEYKREIWRCIIPTAYIDILIENEENHITKLSQQYVRILCSRIDSDDIKTLEGLEKDEDYKQDFLILPEDKQKLREYLNKYIKLEESIIKSDRVLSQQNLSKLLTDNALTPENERKASLLKLGNQQIIEPIIKKIESGVIKSRQALSKEFQQYNIDAKDKDIGKHLREKFVRQSLMFIQLEINLGNIKSETDLNGVIENRGLKLGQTTKNALIKQLNDTTVQK